MTDREPKVGISIDIEADGKQFGHLSVPNSRNESGWGALHLPIVSIRNGAGPTVAFTGCSPLSPAITGSRTRR